MQIFITDLRAVENMAQSLKLYELTEIFRRCGILLAEYRRQ
jgi:hypothetical protein